ncbi:adenylate kinase [Candidatus Woesearchaeota archaeon]|nr:adenylate kinase [Candidatus Woesearchaeota archaeon]
MILIFLGPPGVGKGTISAKMVERFGVVQISSGDLLRATIQLGYEEGIEAKMYMDRGNLVPDSIVNKMINERIAKPDCKNGFILDGYPRTVKQAIDLEGMGVNVDKVLSFVLDDSELVGRISGRRICKRCGFIYNTRTNPTKEIDVCDNCQGELFLRDDDRPEAVMQRLDVHREKTAKLIEYYGKKKMIATIDASGTSDEVFERCMQTIKEAGYCDCGVTSLTQ